ncbi:MAG: aspartyl protease family protein [Candidatus Heimdallarchaeota archaeon]|nr:aspartyl protease family protein [Candidatus Heimdallarchaeota archaeon]MBY8992945.1 aspartyl protease family protein [Candidatus Heimdallarchaeota archaeon]
MTIEDAQEMFSQGKFEKAKESYSKLLTVEPENYEVIKQLGKIALYSNKFSEAEELLAKAIALKSEEREPKLLLVEVYYRQDEFQKAASVLKQIGEEDQAERYESFKEVTPNQIAGNVESTKIKFIQTDPLPVLQVRINDGEPINFTIDTGASELVIDTEFAKEVGLKSSHTREGIFAGGKKAAVQIGKIDTITLGELTVKNVPVTFMPVRQFSAPVFGGMQINGIIGSTLFYHFITTMDYVKGELVLRRKTEANIQQIEEQIENQNIAQIPFWMAGKHFIVAWGKVNKSKPMLFFVDTGLAGGGFTCSETTIKEAGIELLRDQTRMGSGGGGMVQIIPFIVDDLCLGEFSEKNIRGFFAGGKPLSEMVGFHIGGIISHTFFRNYALTFDFTKMRLLLQKMT